MALVALFSNLVDAPNLVLVFLLLFLMSFQASQGSFFFTYVAEIGVDATVAWANFVMFCFVLVFALITQDLFDSLGSGYTFMLFAICNFIATITMSLMLKEIDSLSKSEKKAAFSSGANTASRGSFTSSDWNKEVHGGDNVYIEPKKDKDSDVSVEYN